MPTPQRPRTPEELAEAVAALAGPQRIERIIGLSPVAPPEGHAYYVFVVLRDGAADARVLEEQMYRRFAPRRPRVEFWVMGDEEWEQSHQRVGHPARSAHLEGTVLRGPGAGLAESSPAA